MNFLQCPCYLGTMKESDSPLREQHRTAWIHVQLGKSKVKTREQNSFCQNNRSHKTLRSWCRFDDHDLAWLSEQVLHLSGAAFPSPGPRFHHLAHHSKHFNNTVLMLKRSPRGLDDTPINQAHRARLLHASFSRDGRRGGKQRQEEGGFK